MTLENTKDGFRNKSSKSISKNTAKSDSNIEIITNMKFVNDENKQPFDNFLINKSNLKCSDGKVQDLNKTKDSLDNDEKGNTFGVLENGPKVMRNFKLLDSYEKKFTANNNSNDALDLMDIKKNDTLKTDALMNIKDVRDLVNDDVSKKIKLLDSNENKYNNTTTLRNSLDIMDINENDNRFMSGALIKIKDNVELAKDDTFKTTKVLDSYVNKLILSNSLDLMEINKKETGLKTDGAVISLKDNEQLANGDLRSISESVINIDFKSFDENKVNLTSQNNEMNYFATSYNVEKNICDSTGDSGYTNETYKNNPLKEFIYDLNAAFTSVRDFM